MNDFIEILKNAVEPYSEKGVAFKSRDVISMADFNADEIMCVLDAAKQFKHAHIEHKNKKLPFSSMFENYRFASLFFEESTRTSGSFETAIKALGAEFIGFSDPKAKSVSKGEPLIDSIRMYINYCADLVIMRHPVDGSARFVADKIDVPVISGGDGANQHPTQAFLDMYTILETQGRLDNLVVAFAGDLKYSRTVHSLLPALHKFKGNKFLFVSPEQLRMPNHIIKNSGIGYNECSLEEALHSADIVYDTRIQKNRFPDTPEGRAEYEKVKDAVKLTAEIVLKSEPKKTMRIMHPLPRDKTALEIGFDVDRLEHACYIQQAENGVYAREALISLVMHDLNGANRDFIPEKRKHDECYKEITPHYKKEEKSNVIVRLENGTCIDHIPNGKGKLIADLLKVYENGTQYAIGGVLEGKRGIKDMIKLHDRPLTEEEIRKIAIVAPLATVNEIKEGEVVRKLRLTFPDVAEKLLLCRNPNCISKPEMNEGADSIFYRIAFNPKVVKCHYCERTIEEKDIKLI